MSYGEDSWTASHRITVDYDRPLAEMIEAGRYDWVNQDLTAENFPLEGSGKAEREAIVVTFATDKTPDEARRGIEGLGIRPARLEDLLAFGEQHPDLQRLVAVVALGTEHPRAGGGTVVPDIFDLPGERNLRLMFSGGPASVMRYLAVA